MTDQTDATLIEALTRTARDHPRRGIAVADKRGRRFQRYTYPDMLAHARQSAGQLAALGARAGEPVVLALGTGMDLLSLWLGALYVGALPVNIASAASLGGAKAQLARLEETVARLACRVLIGSEALRTAAAGSGFAALREAAHTVAEVRAAAPAEPASQAFWAQPETPAFLQLTSGSTGTARAVTISHRAAIHNTRAIDHGVGARLGAAASEWAESVVSWLPLNHDMGLVGGLLYALIHGHDLWLLSPQTFLAYPQVWLRELGRHGPALAPAPNFAYHTCASQAAGEPVRGLDLRHWRGAMVGAEMIRPETMRLFAEVFEPAGFDQRALLPCYGLAESTLAMTFDGRGHGVRTRLPPGGNSADSSPVVCLGEPIIDTRVVVCGGDGRDLGEQRVGEVLARGPSNFSGYFGDAQASREQFANGWLRTGDLGFMHDGELYLTGRLKDILIVRGQNFMPHELEWCAERVIGGGNLRCGAFSLDSGGGEQAVIVAEVNPADIDAPEKVIHGIRVEIGDSLGLALADVVLVRRGGLPKTTSGKVQRRRLKQLYQERALKAL